MMFVRNRNSLTKITIQPKWKIFMKENSLSITAHAACFHLRLHTSTADCISVWGRHLVAESTASLDSKIGH